MSGSFQTPEDPYDLGDGEEKTTYHDPGPASGEDGPYAFSDGSEPTIYDEGDGGGEFGSGEFIGGQFEVVRTLGKGDLGIVYEVEDRLTRTRLALKAVLPSALARTDSEGRLMQAVTSCRKLRHPGIVSVYDMGREGAMPFFTMELLKGKSLRVLLELKSRLPLVKTVVIVRLICKALEYAHRTAFHGWIIPENVMVLNDGKVKLLDFGIARSVYEPVGEAVQLSAGSRRKVMYEAPEQRHGAAGADKRADIYALGLMFFEMLTGELPVGSKKVTDFRPDLPAMCDDVVREALAPLEERIPDATQLRKRLEDCVRAAQGASSSAPGPGAREQFAGSLAFIYDVRAGANVPAGSVEVPVQVPRGPHRVQYPFQLGNGGAGRLDVAIGCLGKGISISPAGIAIAAHGLGSLIVSLEPDSDTKLKLAFRWEEGGELRKHAILFYRRD